jgi:hypothetical protein
VPQVLAVVAEDRVGPVEADCGPRARGVGHGTARLPPRAAID